MLHLSLIISPSCQYALEMFLCQPLVLDNGTFDALKTKPTPPSNPQLNRGLFHSMSNGIESIFKGGMSSFYI